MGFFAVATKLLDYTSGHLLPVGTDIVQQRTYLSPEDGLSILDFVMQVAEEQIGWTNCDEKCALKFVKDDEGLAQAVAFILHLAAGSVPRNEETYSSC